MLSIIKTGFALALFTIFSISSFSQPNWELKKEKDGIKVYLTKSDESKIKQFKVETFVDASPREVANAIVDLDNNYKWFVNVEKAQLLKQIGNDEFVFRQVIQVPFPFKDREVIEYCGVKELPNGVIRIELKEDNTFIPETDDYVRMAISRGYWILSPSEGGTEIEYSFLADPGGNIPAWLANQFIVSNPFKTIKGLRKYLKSN
ncbi:START domain-containing protein [Aureitalea sp. L0-47]|uniref:START domain-containing protein n=1 Tax=Aureitalea sp. L0-47 TaxID=2816962 RepID=UPI00223909F6|nr:START domain-containing protein [Aureitalea sp. L0-47]MCW5519856.1 START domain-containing protein [Aureitalea sp. L0-47]